MKKVILMIGALLLFAGTFSACGGQSSAQQAAVDASNNLQSQVYQSKHNIEFRNYNLRQKIADDPATIIWCTFFPPTVGQQPFTVPIAGKLTSSNKRPYDSYRYDNGNAYEIPGPDHMYGASSEYRYGFDPTLTVYYDFTGLASFCTNTPTVWQENKTTIVSAPSAALGAKSDAASNAIRAGNLQKAAAILKGAS